MSPQGNTPGGFTAQPLKPARILLHLLLIAIGAVAGAAGALIQAAWFPGGLLLALLGAAGVCYGGARATGAKGGGFAAGAGWLVAVILLTSSRPEGDFVFGAGLGSYVYLLGGMAVAVMCATVAAPSQPMRPDGRLGK
ncbi:DUF6113 family protein [Streptomyces sp. LHD-70]|uniref:DUF6113 family protein n=1 Tax=Streptomyces sp. LHD-70 TaxID=3072140 RepID=UPI00281094C8|nr:DUF6113 family protein [Streptomyces sp. LHD-70]MDQ8702310.1 DUF6113 family protein [Streptomyces sp. LHD-70]